MGRNGLLTVAEAAEMIGVTDRAVRYFIREEKLHPVYPDGPTKAMYLQERDVCAYIEARRRKTDLAGVADTAQVAYAMGRSALEQLEQIAQFIGLNHHRLQYDEESILALWLGTKDALEKRTDVATAEQVYQWAKNLNAIDAGYLKLVSHYQKTEQPWKPFLEVADKMMAQAPYSSFATDRKLASAYGFLDAARSRLYHISYFYCRTAEGRRKADELFPDNVDDEIINQVFPD